MTTSATPIVRLRTYASFVRFEHTLFTLPLILAGIFSSAGASLTPGRWVLVAVAAVGARTAAMTLNRLIDRRLDALNPRTQGRELPSGRMKLAEAWGLLGAAVTAYLAACWALDPVRFLYLEVAAIPLVVFAAYPFSKRFSAFCHLGVGLGMGLAPLAGYLAAHPDLAHPAAAAWLGAFTLFWGSGFDIIYSTLDEESDRAHGVRSMVAWLGRRRALRVSAALHVAAWLALLAAVSSVLRAAHAVPGGWGLASAVLLGLAAVLLYMEQRWAEDVNLAFFKVNVWVSAVVLAAVLAARLAGGGF